MLGRSTTSRNVYGKYFKASIHLKIFTSVIIHVMNYWGISRYPPCSSSRGNRFSKLSQNRFILHTRTTLLFQRQCNVCTCLAIPSPILHYLFQSLIKNLGLTELQNHFAFDHYYSHKSHSSPDGSSWATVTVCWTVGGYIDAHLNSNSTYMVLQGWGTWLKRYLRGASRGERLAIICFFYLARKTERKLVLAIDLNLMGWNSPKWKRPSFTISALTQRRI